MSTTEPADWAEWKQKRARSIAGEDGWITLVARHFIEPGVSRLGSGRGVELPLSAERAPALLGTIRRDGDRFTFEAAPRVRVEVEGQPVTSLPLVDDRDGKPTVLTHGSLTMRVIKRGDRFALRVKDREHPARRAFAGLTYYPYDPSLRVVARLEPAAPGKTIPIVNVLDQTEAMDCPGTLRFTIAGEQHTLDAVREKGEDELFVLVKDETAGHGTYPSGRFLYAALPGPDGTTVLDFNRAYNPPCAFSDFATCPIPPPQNRLRRKLEAGERYEGAH